MSNAFNLRQQRRRLRRLYNKDAVAKTLFSDWLSKHYFINLDHGFDTISQIICKLGWQKCTNREFLTRTLKIDGRPNMSQIEKEIRNIRGRQKQSLFDIAITVNNGWTGKYNQPDFEIYAQYWENRFRKIRIMRRKFAPNQYP